jgi:hypothetical protein
MFHCILYRFRQLITGRYLVARTMTEYPIKGNRTHFLARALTYNVNVIDTMTGELIQEVR